MKKGLTSSVMSASGSLIDDTRMMIRLCVSTDQRASPVRAGSSDTWSGSFAQRPTQVVLIPRPSNPERQLSHVHLRAPTVKSIWDTKPIMKPDCEVTQVRWHAPKPQQCFLELSKTLWDMRSHLGQIIHMVLFIWTQFETLG